VRKLKDYSLLHTQVLGRKDDEWLIVVIKEIGIHMMLQNCREDINLEERWFDVIPPREIHEFNLDTGKSSIKKKSRIGKQESQKPFEM
jgi:hypothetical protein